MPTKVSASTRSQSTANAVAVLNLIADQPGVMLADIARDTQISKSAAHRLVHTLADYGFIRTDDAGGCVLGYRLIALGRSAARSNPLSEIAVRPMRTLRDDVNETVHLAVVDGDVPVYIEKVESTQVLRHWTKLAEPLPLHCGAASKCLAAFAFDAQRLASVLGDGPLPAYTDHTLTDVAQVLAEVDDIRASGLAISRGEQYEGVAGISVPIFGPNDRRRAVAAVSLAGPSTRFDDDAIARWSERLRSAAREIEERL